MIRPHTRMPTKMAATHAPFQWLIIDSVLSVTPGSEGRKPLLGAPSSAQPARVRAATRPRTTSRHPRGERLPEDGDRTSRPSDTTHLGHFRQDLRPSGHLTANTALVRETARRARGVTLVPTGRGGIRRWRVSVEGVAARA